MNPIKTILVPTDFSRHADEAIEHAIGLAKAFGARIELVHAYRLPISLPSPDAYTLPDRFWEGVRGAAQAKIASVATRIQAEGVKVETHVLSEPPSMAILDIAEKVEADLIVMGTRGLTGLKHVVLGSVAERIVRLAKCPVLTVKDDEV